MAILVSFPPAVQQPIEMQVIDNFLEFSHNAQQCLLFLYSKPISPATKWKISRSLSLNPSSRVVMQSHSSGNRNNKCRFLLLLWNSGDSSPTSSNVLASSSACSCCSTNRISAKRDLVGGIVCLGHARLIREIRLVLRCLALARSVCSLNCAVACVPGQWHLASFPIVLHKALQHCSTARYDYRKCQGCNTLVAREFGL
jgi:hypothetical protein